MNLILFEPAETGRPLPRTDRRALHLVNVLRRAPGDTFDAGIVNGPRGKGTIAGITPEALELTFAWTPDPPAPEPVTLVVGLPRPQTARDILRDATSLGVRAIHFVATEKSDLGYGQSTLWSSGEWRRHVLAGAEQAFHTRIPEVTFGAPLQAALATLPAAATRLALDNYESGARLADAALESGTEHVLAIGGERGWSARDREALRTAGLTLVHLGTRVLRTEIATVAALAILRTKLGLM